MKMKIPQEFYTLADNYLPEIYDINENLDGVFGQLKGAFFGNPKGLATVTAFLDELLNSGLTDQEINRLWQKAGAGLLTTNSHSVRLLLEELVRIFKDPNFV
jgi:hypothetical protein